ncbi:DUF5665 domain-containing protein [Tumebacillus sp. DT12]|uniref:DUF5665 domain-containing protein n=1 Tax=Tumebacillus lacus TaxID=2995335 RepID=A0ABT3WUI8_9BACL|nr:DUF5665 domain-containing protein [Tumebacillus lacus]MCX7568368.1 DUF5665 domain-containing protein [Tumebacillus lacus]
MRRKEERQEETRRRAWATERVDQEKEHAIRHEEQLSRLSEQIERLAVHMERAQFAEYVKLMQRPKRMIMLNLVGGIARGVGVGLGVTVILSVLLILLHELALLNLPLIGDFIARIVKIVEAQMNTPTFQ